jgi:hypothetical protein
MLLSLDVDKKPSKPVVTSQSAMLRNLENWLKDNNYSKLIDADGMTWDVTVEPKQIPDPDDPKGLLWEYQIAITSLQDTETLTGQGTLDSGGDARLIEIIGKHRIPFSMKKQKFVVPREEAARSRLALEVKALNGNLKKSKMIDVKRSLIFRFVDDLCAFDSQFR